MDLAALADAIFLPCDSADVSADLGQASCHARYTITHLCVFSDTDAIIRSRRFAFADADLDPRDDDACPDPHSH